MRWAALALVVCCGELIGAKVANGALVCRAPGQVFLETDAVQFFPASSSATQEVTWDVTDWQGKKLRTGAQKVTTPAPLILTGLPLGYFSLHLAASTGNAAQTIIFARVPVPRRDAESPFALDAAISWLAGPGFSGNTIAPESHFAEAATLARFSGAAEVRDRIRWTDINPNPGVYNWGTYEKNVALEAAAGLPVVSLFHDAPARTRGARQSLPDDLIQLFDFCKAAGAHYGSRVPDWEFWNEPDGSYCKDAAWEFAEAQKAASLGFKAGYPQARVLQGANAIHPTSRFTELLFENGIGGYLDRFNFHLYAKLKDFPSIFASKRAMLATAGVPQLPMWITEMGLLNEGPGGAPSLMSGKKLLEHSPAQELSQAEYATKAMVTAHALGAARSYFFVLPPYNEQDGSKVWGLFRWDWSVKPAFAAMATLTQQTTGQRLRGPVDLGPGVTAYLFQSRTQPESQTVMFWSDTAATVKWPRLPQGGSDLVGQPLLATDWTQAGRFPRYVRGTLGLSPKSEFKRTADLAPVTPLPVILGVAWPDRSAIVNRIAVNLPASTDVRVIVRVHNFSSIPHTVALRATGDDLKLGTLPQNLEVPPGTKKEIPLTVRRGTATDATTLKITGTDAGKTLAPVLIPIRSLVDDFESLPQRPLGITAANRWQGIATGPVTTTVNAAAEMVNFHLQSQTTTDPWVYPKFDLKLPAESFDNTTGVSFEMHAVSAAPSSGILARKAYLITRGANGLRNEFPITMTTDWQRFTILWASDAPGGFDPADVTSIAIGANPSTANFTYEIRKFRVLTAP